MAKGLEGLRRQDGIHAAAVVITKEPLTEYLPDPAQARGRARRPRTRPIVTQYEMHGVEELGLLKMDFLGLRNLDVITDTVEHDPRDARIPTFDIDAVPLDDAGRLRAARAGATRIGVFQLECGADAGPHALAGARPASTTSPPLVALYRPGPMGANMHNDYADRKNGRKPVELLPPRRRGGAGRHLRPDDLPGVGDAGGAEVRRLLPGRGRQPAQGLRQEDPGADGQGAGEVRRRLRGHRLRRASSARSCSTSSSASPTTPSTRATPTATASSPTRPPTSRRTTRSSTWPACSPA